MADEVMETLADGVADVIEQDSAPQAASSEEPVSPAGCNTCMAASDSVLNSAEATQAYAYVMGNVDIRFPNQGMEHEFNRVVTRLVKEKKLTRLDTKTQELKSDGLLLNEMLALKDDPASTTPNPKYMYLANDVCWVLMAD